MALLPADDTALTVKDKGAVHNMPVICYCKLVNQQIFTNWELHLSKLLKGGRAADKKVMLGHRLRRLRREQGLSQSQLAEQLEISPSYLNLIEHNQRPVSAVLLLKLARIFDLDLQSFAEDDESRVLAGLREVFADPAVATGESVGGQDLRELAALAPSVTQAIIELYRAFRAARQEIETLAEQPAGRDGAATTADSFPLDRVHDVF